MKRNCYLSLIILFFSLATQAQKLNVSVNYIETEAKENTNNIYYRPGLVLNWTDFKGNPVVNSEAAAITSAGFGIKLSFRREGNTSDLLISVSCSFSRKDSWVKPAHKTSYILNHEQKHFDIAYIHTMLFIKRLEKGKYTAANYATVIEKIYNESAVEMAKMQHEYDSQTDHSRAASGQGVWDTKISTQLTSIIKNK